MFNSPMSHSNRVCANHRASREARLLNPPIPRRTLILQDAIAIIAICVDNLDVSAVRFTIDKPINLVPRRKMRIPPHIKGLNRFCMRRFYRYFHTDHFLYGENYREKLCDCENKTNTNYYFYPCSIHSYGYLATEAFSLVFVEAFGAFSCRFTHYTSELIPP